MKKIEASRITCIIDRRLFLAIEAELAQLGCGAYYTILSKQVSLVEKNGFLRPRNLLAEERAELLRLRVPRELSANIMYRIAQALDLFLPGRGSIYSENCELLVDDNYEWPPGLAVELEAPPKRALSDDWDLISCIVQRGRGAELARVMLELGLCVPAINYGEGVGLRDKMGLIRITIPVHKEVLCFLVPGADSDFVFDTALRRAGMDEPGKGFLYRSPIQACAVNNLIFRDSRKHIASMEQVITALDELQGSTDWRRLSATNQYRKTKRKGVNELESFSFSCEEGDAQEIANKAMELGVGGATLVRASYHKPRQSQDNGIANQARETCDLILRSDQAELLERELMPQLLKLKNAFAERLPVKDAKAYLGENSTANAS